jgi:polysaccharide export outer membrane protein
MIQKIELSCSLSRGLLTLWLVAFLAAGCAAMQPHQPTLPPQAATSQAQAEINRALVSRAVLAPTSSADYRLGPEDLIEITLYSVVEETGVTPRKTETRVSQQGVITLPLLGDITAAGLTTTALEQMLQKRYKKYLRNPKVGVFVKEYNSQRISVIGEVRQPGVFKISGPKTLIDLLAMAGGITEKAGRQVHLYRQGPEKRESYVVDLYALAESAGASMVVEANLLVQGGDVINIPEAGMFFVDGAVKRAGSFPLNRPYTLSQAISTAGGADIEIAKTSDVIIIRKRGSIGAESETIPVNLDMIQTGKTPDPQIEAGDVVFVSLSVPKYLVKHFVYGFSLSSFFY